MLSEQDHVLIGLSGGPDSVCLTVILNNLRTDFNLSLSALYIDHQLRPDEVEREIAFCRGFCESLDIRFHIRSIDVRGFAKQERLNLQEAARELRYRTYQEVAGEINATKIALGHNADDQAETMIMRLIRGAGRRGLSGMPSRRKQIIRPLIETERAGIEAFLGEMNQDSMIDSSNLRDDYLRNWLRHTFFREIKQWNPAVIADMNRAADILREEDEYLEVLVTKTLMRLISRKGDQSIELFLNPMEIIDRPLLRRILRRAVDSVRGLRRISLAHIDDILGLLRSGKAGDRVHLPDGIRAVRKYATLLITAESLPGIAARDLNVPGETVLDEIGMAVGAHILTAKEPAAGDRNSVLLDLEKIALPLRVRMRRDGDVFYPSGFGQKKKLQDFFVDEKIPRDDRQRVPIITSGNDIIWIAGFRADERFKATETTKKYLRLTIKKL